MSETDVWDTELGQLLSKGAAYLAAANGIEKDAFAPWVHDGVPAEAAASLPTLRRAGVEFFQKAAQLQPDEPWIWYVIGWNLFAYEDGPCEPLVARDALEHVLTLQGDHPLAHLALAWLLYREVEHVGRDTPDLLKSVWEGPIGEHLRAGFNLERLLFSYLSSDLIPSPNLVKVYWNRLAMSWRGAIVGTAPLTLALDALGEIVPDEFRFSYCVAHGYLEGKPEDIIR